MASSCVRGRWVGDAEPSRGDEVELGFPVLSAQTSPRRIAWPTLACLCSVQSIPRRIDCPTAVDASENLHRSCASGCEGVYGPRDAMCLVVICMRRIASRGAEFSGRATEGLSPLTKRFSATDCD